MPTAILIDGEFFLKRYRRLCGGCGPQKAAKDLHRMCLNHLVQSNRRCDLYRIFYYDCPPLTKKAQYPVSGTPVDFSRTATAVWRVEFHQELRRLRKVALRLGVLNEKWAEWAVKPQPLKRLLRGEITVADLTDADLKYVAPQKGVDMRIGLDIASMTLKKQVDQIILVSGDSDFVPAAKLARREGVDFVLDPMWAVIRPDLHEHVDGIRTVLPRPVDGGKVTVNATAEPTEVEGDGGSSQDSKTGCASEEDSS